MEPSDPDAPSEKVVIYSADREEEGNKAAIVHVFSIGHSTLQSRACYHVVRCVFYCDDINNAC